MNLSREDKELQLQVKRFLNNRVDLDIGDDLGGKITISYALNTIQHIIQRSAEGNSKLKQYEGSVGLYKTLVALFDISLSTSTVLSVRGQERADEVYLIQKDRLKNIPENLNTARAYIAISMGVTLEHGTLTDFKERVEKNDPSLETHDKGEEGISSEAANLFDQLRAMDKALQLMERAYKSTIATAIPNDRGRG